MHEGEAHAAMPDTTPQPEFRAPRIEPQRFERPTPVPVAPTPEPVAETPPSRRGSTVREPAPIVRYDDAGAPPAPATPPPLAPAPAAEPTAPAETEFRPAAPQRLVAALKRAQLAERQSEFA